MEEEEEQTNTNGSEAAGVAVVTAAERGYSLRIDSFCIPVAPQLYPLLDPLLDLSSFFHPLLPVSSFSDVIIIISFWKENLLFP